MTEEEITDYWTNIVNNLEKENAELKAQIEKMKCCSNCMNYVIHPTRENNKFCIECKKLDKTKDNIILTKWELTE